MLSTEYLAGLFDGEGYITISHMVSKKPGSIHERYQLIVGISMTHKPLIEMLHKQLGGTFHASHKRAKPTHRTLFSWILGSKVAARFLESVLPYSVVKKPEAELAIEFQKHVDQYRGKLGNQYRLHPERARILRERQNMKDKLLSLKHPRFS